MLILNKQRVFQLLEVKVGGQTLKYSKIQGVKQTNSFVSNCELQLRLRTLATTITNQKLI